VAAGPRAASRDESTSSRSCTRAIARRAVKSADTPPSRSAATAEYQTVH
jgi:hypothetical protein